MNYWNFVKVNSKLLSFGLIMTCLSGYGQTYLLALYIPYLIEEFSLQNAQISVYYMVATIGSALLLPQVGKYIDKVSLKKYTYMATLIFIMAMILMSFNQYWYFLPLAFFGLRMAGQGLFSHIAITSMSKYFLKGRGKAISLASLGHPFGQAALPIMVVGLINLFGWRSSLLVNALIVLILVPIFLHFVIDEEKLVVHEESHPKGSQASKSVSQWDIMKSGKFWLLAPNMFVLSFTVTGLFFYQFAIAEFKGWTLEWMAIGLTFYAIAGSLAILFAGPMIDKFTARKFFPFYLFPFLLAVVFIYMVESAWVIFPYMILMGVSAGFGNAIMSALQVELFGASFIGKVRSIFASIMVLSSAVGPAVYGVVVDAGYSFDILFSGSSILLLLVIIQSFRIIPNYTYAKMKYKFKKRHRRFDFFNILNLRH